MVRKTTAVLVLLLLFAGVSAQGNEGDEATQGDTAITAVPGIGTEVAPGITVFIESQATGPLEIAQEIFHYPHFVEHSIPFDKDYTSFNLELASKISTRILVDIGETEDLISRADAVVVPAGSRISIDFAAFAPHSGLIRLLNEDMVLLAEVPYVITKESRFQQTVSGYATTNASTDFTQTEMSPISIGVGYSVTERESGIGVGFSVDYSTNGSLNASGTISGSHTW